MTISFLFMSILISLVVALILGSLTDTFLIPLYWMIGFSAFITTRIIIEILAL